MGVIGPCHVTGRPVVKEATNFGCGRHPLRRAVIQRSLGGELVAFRLCHLLGQLLRLFLQDLRCVDGCENAVIVV